MKLQGKKIAIMLDQQYQELEVWYPYYRLKEEGADLALVGPQAGATYGSKLGYPCVSTAAARDVDGGDFDAVLVPGGWCPDFMRRDESMIRFIRQAAEADVVLAAICHGGWMLCCTDALRGKRATSFLAIRHDMMNAGCDWVDRECVVDGKLITARKPDDLPAWTRAIIDALA
ncbi:MAG: General stress protein 18 [Planctomycetes bacterium ADurb.Bin126]|nr:MAG: General stress protein 18 [Planctomycetes bacterium ADurb.Bin126]HOD83411.1 type 1 glutamine amidotransferase domain-containing protein [Phycisphaerae bacterium]HQL75204.1 type 1 glutamine amidotransferase domain-containing protein [Phycisphaerae bacterium]